MSEKLKEFRKAMRDKKDSVIPCIIFLILIFGLTIASILTPDRLFSENENRFLAEKPEFTVDSLISGKYTADYEKYITDQFVLRDSWIGLKTLSERAMLKQDINGVYFGKDGYLIEKHNRTDIDEEQAKRNIERLAQFVNTYGDKLGREHLKVLLVPTASEILTDKLPAYASGYDQMAFIDRVRAAFLNESNSGADVGKTENQAELIDISQMLKNHDNEYIYYRTDHHWTSLGAYYAYQQWAEASGLEPLGEDDFKIETVTDQFYGTIYSKVNVKAEPDSINLYYQTGDPAYHVEYNMGEKTMDSLYDMEQLKGKDKYSVFLGGNNALVRIKSENHNGKKLLVIKDSFAHSFVPFAAAHFEETIMVDLRYYNMSLSEFTQNNEVTDILVLYNVINFAKDKNTVKLIK